MIGCKAIKQASLVDAFQSFGLEGFVGCGF
jgi:hypothetical protein